jgi:metal-dependent amidase/aminoacylase/carboxypeptidase family protein
VTRFEAGSAYNVVPASATLAGTIRYFHDDVIEMAEQRMRDLCAGMALAHGIEIEVDLRNVFDVLMNDAELSTAYVEAAQDVVGERAHETTDQMTGSEDFADMLKLVPGAYCRVGHAGSVPLHNPAFVLDDAILPVGASIYARIVERRLRPAA